MTTYTVRYRKRGQRFWRTLDRVKADDVGRDLPHLPRVFMLEDGTRIEVPNDGLEVRFSPQRMTVLRENAEREAMARSIVETEAKMASLKASRDAKPAEETLASPQ